MCRACSKAHGESRLLAACHLRQPQLPARTMAQSVARKRSEWRADSPATPSPFVSSTPAPPHSWLHWCAGRNAPSAMRIGRGAELETEWALARVALRAARQQRAAVMHRDIITRAWGGGRWVSAILEGAHLSLIITTLAISHLACPRHHPPRSFPAPLTLLLHPCALAWAWAWAWALASACRRASCPFTV